MAEILSPCGSPEALTAAIGCGCDAVYIGSKAFSARQNAKNFSNEELKEAVKECHRNGVLVYQAINTLVFDSQLDEVAKELKAACEIGIDGIIVQDLGVIEIAKKLCPSLPLHASTQMSIHTKNGVLLCRDMGLKRVVVSRELSIDTIRELCRQDVEIEAFVHGALCMSVSGQCYMSALIGQRSANRGLCAQACRLPFSAIKGQDRYDLSLKDMSHIKSAGELVKAGVSSLKIEGRMKRPEYVAAATNSLYSELCSKEYDDSLLRAVFSRSGFTDGYLYGRLGRDMFGIREKEDVTSAKDALPKLHELYRRPHKRFSLSFEIKIHKDVPVTLTAKSSDGITATVTASEPQIAQSRDITPEIIEKQLSKLGSTQYEFEKAECEIENGLTLPASVLNELRRLVCEELDKKRVESYEGRYQCSNYIAEKPQRRSKRKTAIRLNLSFASQLSGLDLEGVELVSLPVSEVKKLSDIPSYICASLPRFDFNEQETKSTLSELCERGLAHVLVTNLSQIETAKGMGLSMHGDFGLNVTNSLSAKMLSELSLCDITASFELTAKQLGSVSSPIPLGFIGYGKLPSMLTVNCPLKQAVGCKSCKGVLSDKTGRSFEVKCSKRYVEILNSEPLYLADKLSDFDSMDFVTLMFHKESPQEINKVIGKYKSLSPAEGKITRGLYYRGII